MTTAEQKEVLAEIISLKQLAKLQSESVHSLSQRTLLAALQFNVDPDSRVKEKEALLRLSVTGPILESQKEAAKQIAILIGYLHTKFLRIGGDEDLLKALQN